MMSNEIIERFYKVFYCNNSIVHFVPIKPIISKPRFYCTLASILNNYEELTLISKQELYNLIVQKLPKNQVPCFPALGSKIWFAMKYVGLIDLKGSEVLYVGLPGWWKVERKR